MPIEPLISVGRLRYRGMFQGRWGRWPLLDVKLQEHPGRRDGHVRTH